MKEFKKYFENQLNEAVNDEKIIEIEFKDLPEKIQAALKLIKNKTELIEQNQNYYYVTIKSIMTIEIMEIVEMRKYGLMGITGSDIKYGMTLIFMEK